MLKGAKSGWGLRAGIFLGVFFFAVGWVTYTDHAWEDYFITYRASKNLAEGNGLTDTVGERVHSFTSPLGVLLPATAYWIGGGESDRSALWVLRIMGAMALTVAVTLGAMAAQRTLGWASGWGSGDSTGCNARGGYEDAGFRDQWDGDAISADRICVVVVDVGSSL